MIPLSDQLVQLLNPSVICGDLCLDLLDLLLIHLGLLLVDVDLHPEQVLDLLQLGRQVPPPHLQTLDLPPHGRGVVLVHLVLVLVGDVEALEEVQLGPVGLISIVFEIFHDFSEFAWVELMEFALDVCKGEGARIHLHLDSLNLFIVCVSLTSDLSLLLVQLTDLLVRLNYRVLRLLDPRLLIEYLLLQLLDLVKGSLIGLPLEEGLLGEDSELSLHPISLDPRLLDPLHQVLSLLGCVLCGA